MSEDWIPVAQFRQGETFIDIAIASDFSEILLTCSDEDGDVTVMPMQPVEAMYVASALQVAAARRAAVTIEPAELEFLADDLDRAGKDLRFWRARRVCPDSPLQESA